MGSSKGETYEVYDLHKDLLLTRLLLFLEKGAKCTVKISQVIGCESMYRPTLGFVISFPSKLGCGAVQGHVGENVIEKIFAGNVRGEVDVAKYFVSDG